LAAQQAPAGQAQAAASSKPASFGPPVAQGQPSWTQAMPETAGAADLRPQVPPPIPTPADKLPLARLKVPNSFRIEVFASGMPQARSLRVGDKGTVFVSTRTLDRIYAIVNKNGKREVKTLLSGLHWPNGIALHNGTLYIAELNRISKIDDIEDRLDNPPKPTAIYSDLPSYEPHGWKFLTVGPDNRLYFNVGAPCNICMPPPTNAQLRSIALDGSDMKIVAHGIRQVVGMDFDPTSKVLYFTENQRDWLSEDEPNDKLNRLLHPGMDNFGFPYCDGGNIEDPIYGWGHNCNQFTKPVAQLGPHAAPLGMRFYTGHMFPRAYRDAIFIAEHGSWNKTHKIGGQIVVATLNRDGTVRSVKPFMTGFLQNNQYVGRPVDVEWMKDGSMLVSDDWNGAVYRVTYGAPPVHARR
ncbi:MAG TPA: PQQ-dependent sugar dehydrogenase, partial [Stellaceae bacterium]|nr:PQQ-dependent sugar dehydrogenase [Stellaceae bacterium]